MINILFFCKISKKCCNKWPTKSRYVYHKKYFSFSYLLCRGMFKILKKKSRGKSKFCYWFFRASVIGLKNWLMHAVSKLWYVIRIVEFSSGRYKIKKDFCLRINIPRRNYWILRKIIRIFFYFSHRRMPV